MAQVQNTYEARYDALFEFINERDPCLLAWFLKEQQEKQEE